MPTIINSISIAVLSIAIIYIALAVGRLQTITEDTAQSLLDNQE